MEELLEYLQATFENGFNENHDDLCTTAEIVDFYHGNVYTEEQLKILTERGNPAEQFNVVSMFANQLLGYYGRTITNTVALPRTPDDAEITNVLNDIVNFDNDNSNWRTEGNDLKLYGMLVGYAVAKVSPVTVVDANGKPATDKVGREHMYVNKEYVSWDEVILDSNSSKNDYSDGSFIHVIHHMSPSEIRSKFGKSYVSKLEDVDDVLTSKGSDRAYNRFTTFDSDMYNNQGTILVIHSVYTDVKGDRWSAYWSKGIMLKRTKLDAGDRGDYLVTKIKNDKNYAYSLFKSSLPTIKAINQAIIQIHMLVNATKVFWTEGGIETENDGLKKFVDSISRVNSLTKVLDLKKIKVVENQSDIIKQYNIIDRGLQRIQLMLGVNDSFLGVAYASDSGKKVNLQKGATIMALDYLTERMVLMYQQIGEREYTLIQKHMIAERILRVKDTKEEQGYRWVYVNKPLLDEDGKPHSMGEKGKNFILNVNNTDILSASVDYSTVATTYVNDEEVNQVMLETVANGLQGQALLGADPASFFELSEIVIGNTGTRSAPKVAKIFASVADKLRDAQDPTNYDPNQQPPQLGGQPSNSIQAERVPNAR